GRNVHRAAASGAVHRMKPITSSTHLFSPVLDSLFRSEDGFIELRALPGRARTFVIPGDNTSVQRFIDDHEEENIYFAVAARRDSTSGRLENCSFIRAVFADIDFKAFQNPDEATSRLQNFPLPPSIVINSGGGLHCYWLLDPPVDLQRNSSMFRSILRRT